MRVNSLRYAERWLDKKEAEIYYWPCAVIDDAGNHCIGKSLLSLPYHSYHQFCFAQERRCCTLHFPKSPSTAYANMHSEGHWHGLIQIFSISVQQLDTKLLISMVTVPSMWRIVIVWKGSSLPRGAYSLNVQFSLLIQTVTCTYHIKTVLELLKSYIKQQLLKL